jgi:hypothetical protein
MIKKLFSLLPKNLNLLELIRKKKKLPKTDNKIYFAKCESSRKLKGSLHYHKECFNKKRLRKSPEQRNKIIKQYKKRAKRKKINLVDSCLFCSEYLGVGGVPDGLICGE